MSGRPNAVRVRAVVAAVLLVAAAGAAHVMRPTVHLVDQQTPINLETLFPKSFGPWRIDTDVPASIVSPDVEAKLKSIYAETLSRTYVGPDGARIMLSVAYGGDQSDATRAHSPDVCYPSQGFEILYNRDTRLDLGGRVLPVRHMSSRLAQRYEPVTFWFVIGEHVALSGQQQKIAQLRYGVRGLIPDGILVRVSSIDRDTDAGYRAQARFVTDMHASMSQAARLRVFGSDIAGPAVPAAVPTPGPAGAVR